MSNNNAQLNGHISNKQKEEWTLPVMDSSQAKEQQGFDPENSGAWTSFAIGAVTKSVERERLEPGASSESN